MTRWRSHVGRVATIGVVLSIGVVGACSSTGSQAVRGAGVQSRPTPAQVGTVPHGFQRPAHILADPNGRGLWFASTSNAATTLFLWDTTSHSLRSWLLLAQHIDTGIENGIAVASDGAVWVGTGNLVARVDVTTGKLAALTLPSVADVPEPEAHRPPELRGLHELLALAPGPNAGVVALMADAGEVLSIGSDLKVHARLQLPVHTDGTSIATLPDGSVAVGLRVWSAGQGQNSAVLVRNPAGQVSTMNVPAEGISRAGSSFLTTDGIGHAYRLQTDGASVSVNAVGSAPLAVRAMPGAAVLQLPNGKLATQTTNGFAVWDPIGGQQIEFSLPQFDCGPPSIVAPLQPAAPPTSANSPRTCGQFAIDLSLAPDGTLWYLGSGPTEAFGAASPSDYS